MSKKFWMSGKQCWPWSDADLGSTLFAHMCLSHYLGYIGMVVFLLLYHLQAWNQHSSIAIQFYTAGLYITFS